MGSFAGYLTGLQGHFVQVERGGPDACRGWLRSVQSDYLTLWAAGGCELHLPLHHLRSVTPHPPPAAAPPPAEPPPATFAALLAAVAGRRVRLYHAGPEVGAGVLRECAGDHLLLEVAPDQVACYALFHVRSLTVLEQREGDGGGDLDPCPGGVPADGGAGPVAPGLDA